MREIKFRGKPTIKNMDYLKDKEWIYGGIVYDEDRVWIDVPYYGNLIVDKHTIGQYTGLKDKNGKEIYEGDIVKAKHRGYIGIGQVQYDNEYCDYKIYINENKDYVPLWKSVDLEVIRKHI